MLALSGYAEWFWTMAMNIKPIENRSKALPKSMALALPIRIYLHASKTITPKEEMNFIEKNLTPEQLSQFQAVNWVQLRGRIIGEITITKQIRKETENPKSQYGMGGIFSTGDIAFELENMKTRCPEYFSPWFFGPFGYEVTKGVLYPAPYPYRGQLGFFEVRI
jgi:hypothetical protein